MAKSNVDDAELRRACVAAVEASSARREEVAFSIRVTKGRGIFDKLGRLAKHRILALTGQFYWSSPALPAPLLSMCSFSYLPLLRFVFLHCTDEGDLVPGKKKGAIRMNGDEREVVSWLEA
ncbi:hypothetical protein EJB05_31951, partial [Eragrostis curvula]